jgi:hypothetical protein
VHLAHAVLAALTILANSPARPTAGPSQLQINEFMAGPARDWDGGNGFSARDDEWIELLNLGSVPVELAAYLITDGDSIPRCALSGVLPGNQRLVVFGSVAYEWERLNGYPAVGLSLANSGDRVMLWQVTGSDTVLVDSYVYRSHQAAADRAMGRLPEKGDWSLFDGLNPYTGTAPPFGNGCVPTPGEPNSCAKTPIAPTSWGAIKTRYR